ncbi:MAG: pirin family protein [Pseudomonadota bacterium]
MLSIRRSEDRGKADFGWLQSRHTFSFGQYHDPEHEGFGPLRVINDDHVAPGGGFAPHGHRDMEIISYVLDGALAHSDSTGGGSVIRPGDVQRMTAGSGVRHSEFNDSKSDPVHFLQIWIEPADKGLEPSYEQVSIPQSEKRGHLRIIGTNQPEKFPYEEIVKIHQDVNLYAGFFDEKEEVTFEIGKDRAIWLHLAQGQVNVAGETLYSGDAIAITDIERVEIKNGRDAEVLLFDLPR